ncbi:LPS export ABC transporter periplasmic protein LptC [Porticoccaceae bacterium]|nr:LPS export ABC transporter periplasmic protein LptC [Porticoccaceae bacterium]
MIQQFLLVSSLIIIVGGFLLVWDSPPESFMGKQTGQVEEVPVADSFMSDINSRKFALDGTELFVVTAPRVEFFAKSSTVNLQQPNLSSKGAVKGRDNLNLSANNGVLSGNGKKLLLNGDVLVRIEGDQGNTVLRADNLAYLPDSNIATTNDPFNLQTPQVKLSGKGLNANLTDEVFTIKSKVRAIHEPL